MVEWPLVLGGIAAIVPAFGVLFASYASYDGYFRDNVMFLFFMGGLFSGVAVVVFELLLLLPRDALYIAAMVLVGFPILESLLKLMVLNRRAYQGERETTFFGGAFGLGFATMVVLFKSQREIPLLGYRDLGVVLTDPWPLLYLLIVGTSVTLVHFATGLLIGDGVRRRALRPGMVRAIAASVPLQFLVFEFVRGLAAQAAALIYLPLMLGYALALAWWAHATLLPKALPPEAQRRRRRLLVREKRAELEKR